MGKGAFSGIAAVISTSPETISLLLGSLYEAAATPERWPTFFQNLRGSIHSDISLFVFSDPEQRCDINISLGVEPEWHQAYETYFFRHNILFERYLAKKRIHGEWVGTGQTVIPDDQYLRSVFYGDFMKPQQQIHHLGAMLGGLEGGIEGGLTLHRSSQSGPFHEQEIALVAILAPHLQRALNLHRELARQRSQNAEMRQTLESLDVGLISLNGCGQVLRMTSVAEAILGARDGIVLDKRRLSASSAKEHAKLTDLIAGSVATGQGRGTDCPVARSTGATPEARSASRWTPASGGAVLISRRAPKRPLQLMVTPFYSSEILLNERPAAIVFVRDPDANPPSRAAVLRALYGLSPTECRLSEMLAQGTILSAAADQLGMSVGTARFHLKSIFRKTGIDRQAHLVRLVVGLPSASAFRAGQ